MATPERKPAFDLEAEVESAPQPQIPPRQTTNDATKHSPDPLQRQAWDLLKEMTDAFRERQQFGSGGGTRSPSGVAVERIKLLANFFNTIAAGLLTAGLIVLSRTALATDAAKLVLGTSALFALAIVGTQYKVGGSMEWGGRFFHLALPAL